MNRLDLIEQKEKILIETTNQINREIIELLQQVLDKTKEDLGIGRIEYYLENWGHDGFTLNWRILDKEFKQIEINTYKILTIDKLSKNDDKYESYLFIDKLFDSYKEEWDDYIEWEEDIWTSLKFGF